MSTLRVLQIGPYSRPHGGVQGHIVALRQYLTKQGVSCEVIDLNQQRRTDGAGIYGPKNAFDLARLLLSLRYDIVHLHIGGLLSQRLVGLAFLTTLRGHRKSIFTFHSGGYPSSPEGRGATPSSLRSRVMRRFERVIAVNEEIAAWFRQVGVAAERISVIHPYALPAAPPPIEPPEPLRSFLTQHSPVLISVGLLEPEYDLPIQIDVLGHVRERFPKAGLVIVGSGSAEGELREHASKKPYSEHILLCGDVERDLTLRVIAESDMMLRTTLYDGDSISVREAVHFGVPVVATDRAPRPEGVHVIPAQDLARLSEATASCLNNGGRRSHAIESYEENLKAVLSLYEDVMSVRG